MKVLGVLFVGVGAAIIYLWAFRGYTLAKLTNGLSTLAKPVKGGA